MFDRLTIRAADRAASEDFYATVLEPLGGAREDFAIAPAGAGHPPTRRLHLAFFAPSRELVDAFWQAGTAAGHPDAGAPGMRTQYSPDYYGAFVSDPDGNSAEAVHHGRTRATGRLDHLWIRVADVAAARAFYLALAPRAGFALGDDTPQRVQFATPRASVSFVAGEPTEHVRLEFPGGRGEPGAELRDPDGNAVVLVAHR